MPVNTAAQFFFGRKVLTCGVVGFEGCGLLTILLRQLWALRSNLWA
jgi:hypothetical protein